MRKFKMIIGIVLIGFSLLVACDDFFSPVIEIFNEVKTPIDIEQEQKKELQQINQ